MQKVLYFILIFSLAFQLSAFAKEKPTTAHTPSASPSPAPEIAGINQKMSELLEKLEQIKGGCDTVVEQLKKFRSENQAQLVMKNASDYHALREIALKIKPFSSEAQDIIELLMVAANRGWAVNFGSYFKMRYCTPLLFWDAVQGVVVGGESFKASKSQKRAFAEQIVRQIKTEIERPLPQLNLQINLSIAKIFMERGWIQASDALYIEFLNMEERVLALKRDLNVKQNEWGLFKVKNLDTKKKEELEAIQKSVFLEIDATNVLRYRLYSLLHRIEFES